MAEGDAVRLSGGVEIGIGVVWRGGGMRVRLGRTARSEVGWGVDPRALSWRCRLLWRMREKKRSCCLPLMAENTGHG